MEIKIENDYIGWLETDIILFSYTDAMKYLFKQLSSNDEWGWMRNEYPKSQFNLYVQTGVNNYGENIYVKLETFKISKLRKLEKLNIKF
jgi:hypothetical protein